MNHYPSRYDNPFATCWTRPGAIPFRFSEGESLDRLIARLAKQHWRGAITGAHGSGKSTLLAALKPALSAAGCQLQQLTIRPRSALATACGVTNDAHAGFRAARSTPRAYRGRQVVLSPSTTSFAPPRALAHKQRLVIVDGYEQLNRFSRLWLIACCRHRNFGLLVTAHAPTILPTLIELAPDRQLIHKLVADLSVHVSTSITSAQVDASHASHGSNVREILFDLYDHHERLRRTARTYAVQPS